MKRGREETVTRAAFWILLAALCGLVLWLPCFPSGDGPVHAYYAQVLRSILRHDAGYSAFYLRRHLIQPYCLQYWVEGALQLLGSSEQAEKEFVVLIVVANATGFRLLAGTLGRNHDLAALWFLPAIIGYSLGAGFESYCLSVGLMFYALALWNGLGNTQKPSNLVWFLCSAVLIVLSQPIPLAVVAGYIVFDMVVRHRQRARLGTASREPGQRQRWAAAMAVLALMGVAASYTQRGTASLLGHNFFVPILLAAIVNLQFVILFSGGGAAAACYVFLLRAIAPVVWLLRTRGFLHRWKAGDLAASDRMLFFSLCFMAFVPFMPFRLSRGTFFAPRLFAMAWPLVLATLAAAPLKRTLRRGLLAGGVLAGVLCLLLVVSELGPEARQQAQMGLIRVPAGARGLLLADPSFGNYTPAKFTYPVQLWSGARAFTDSRAILLNSPWLDESLLPVTMRANRAWGADPVEDSLLYSPTTLYQHLRDPGVRSFIEDRAGFILLQQRAPGEDISLNEWLNGDPAHRWSCSSGPHYQLCIRADPIDPA